MIENFGIIEVGIENQPTKFIIWPNAYSDNTRNWKVMTDHDRASEWFKYAKAQINKKTEQNSKI